LSKIKSCCVSWSTNHGEKLSSNERLQLNLHLTSGLLDFESGFQVMDFLHGQFFKERFLMEIQDCDEKDSGNFFFPGPFGGFGKYGHEFLNRNSWPYFPNPPKEVFQKITTHRKERERGKR
jgi:hypothetical protein